MFYTLGYSPRYVSVAYQKTCAICQFKLIPLHLFFFTHSGMIEIAILVDRLNIFNLNLKKYLEAFTLWKICVIMASFSLVAAISSGFLYSSGELYNPLLV